MADGGQDFNLGHVVGSAGEKGDDGSTVWNTSTAPSYANSKYTFTISNLSGKTGLQIAVNDIIFYSTYYYIVSAVNTTTVDCTTRISIKGSDASVTIVDNLTSTSSTSALSAKQGKVLNDNKIETSSIATSFGSTPSDSKVASEKLVKNSLDAKQATLVSGTNIKTVNNNSLLGSGNITIESGSNVDIVTNWEQTLSDVKVPSEKLTKDSLDTKVDKVTGKGLSTNDFTNSYKNTIDGLSTVATTGDYDDLTDKPSIPSSSSDLSDGSNIVKKSSTSGLLKNDGTVDTTSYSTFSGSYNDLSNKPTIPSASTTTPSADTSSGSYGSGTSYARSNHTHPKSSLYAEATHSHTKSQISDFPTIPTKTSDLTNDGDGTNAFLTQHQSLTNYVQKSSTTGLLKNDGTVMTSGTGSSNYSAGNHTHSAYVNPTKVTSWSATPSDSNVASEKLIKDSLDAKQATLISGTNLKTINNNSLLGSGNINIEGGSGGGGSYINDFYGDSSTNELIIDYDTGVSQADIVTSWSSTVSDSNVPSEKLVKNYVDQQIGTAIQYIQQ